ANARSSTGSFREMLTRGAHVLWARFDNNLRRGSGCKRRRREWRSASARAVWSAVRLAVAATTCVLVMLVGCSHDGAGPLPYASEDGATAADLEAMRAFA